MGASEDLFARAQAVIPGGVNSPVRAFGAVGGTPRFLVRGDGAHVWDADGARFTDYVLSWGPLILGHAHPDVVAAAEDALRDGSSFGAPTAREVELAETLVARLPFADMVRCVSSGTEALMTAIRLARAATGRDVIVKFAGHYHGHSDALLAAAGSGVATLGLPDSPGVTRGAARDTVVVDWNDADAVEKALAEHDVAAVLCEPVPGNMGVAPADAGFLEYLRETTARHGALLVFDEVLCGFRAAPTSMADPTGVTPDLATYGKVLGGGFPLAALAGPRALMQRLAPAGPVYQAGTLSGNPVAVAAGLAQLRLLDAAAHERLVALATRLCDGLAAAFADAGVAARIQRVGSLFSVYFTDAPVRDYAGARAADHDRYARFFRGMLERGHYLPPSGYEAWFVSTAHTDDDIDATVAAAGEVAATLAGGGAAVTGPLPPAESAETRQAPRRRNRSNLWTILAGVVLAAAVVAVAVAFEGAGRPGPAPGESPVAGLGRVSGPESTPLPEVALPQLGGDAEIRLSDYRGRPLVLNFWATWCTPCLNEMPLLAAAAADLRGQVAFLGVDVQDQAAKALRMAAELGVRYDLAEDRDARFFTAMRGVAMPTTLFVDADGVVVYRRAGEIDEARLAELLQDTLGVTWRPREPLPQASPAAQP